jgi:glyoxylase-like metal-dependent hydrolase (beta-lactamase superfamily II)
MGKANKPYARLLRVSTTRMDGGRLFGSTPKEKWERFASPDRQNRVAIGNHSMLINHPDGWVLVNAGPGDKAPLSLDVAPVRSRSSLLRDLREMGLMPKDIRVVIYTHLWDEYAGGGTHMTSSGRVLPTFSNARYVVHRAALDEAKRPSERVARAYRADDVEPLEEAGVLEVVDGATEVARDVWVEPAPGPASGHQIVIAEHAGTSYAFMGGLVPTSLHLNPQVCTAADRNPDATVRTKIEVCRQAMSENWQVGPVGPDEWVGAKDLAALSAFSAGTALAPVEAPVRAAGRKTAGVAA